MDNTRNNTIDLFKFVAALLVIAIHVEPFKDIDHIVDFVVSQILCRCAMPYFAICTGFFLSVSRKQKQGRDLRYKIGIAWIRTIKLYFVWTVVYLIASIPVWVETSWFSAWAFVDYFLGAITKGSHYHLWYLLSLIYALPIFYYMVKYIPEKFYLLLATILYIFKSISYVYLRWMPVTIIQIFGVLEKISGFRDAVLVIVPFLLIGLYSKQKWLSFKTASIGLLCSLILLFIESYICFEIGQEQVYYTLTRLPTSYFLFQWIYNIQIHFSCKRLRDFSIIIYCIHPLIIELIQRHFSFPKLILYFTVAILSIVFSLLIKIFDDRISISNL